MSTQKKKELKMTKSGRFIFGRAIFIWSTKKDENEATDLEQNHLGNVITILRDKSKE